MHADKYTLEQKLFEDMKSIYSEAKKIGYTPTRFMEMLANEGGLKVAKNLINSKQPSDGFNKLWELKRLDLTVEALILKSDYRKLFTENELDIVKDRLNRYGYGLIEDSNSTELKSDELILSHLTSVEKEHFDANDLIQQIKTRDYKSGDDTKYYILTIKIAPVNAYKEYFKYLTVLMEEDLIIQVESIEDARRNILTESKKIGLVMLYQLNPSVTIDEITMLHYKTDRTRQWNKENKETLLKLIDELVNENQINENSTRDLVNTEKSHLIKIRIGQQWFKQSLLKREKKCSICSISDEKFLIGSHIKPWRVANNKERLDVHNGLLLCPNHDALFDRGYISFNEQGMIMLSTSVDISSYQLMGINNGVSIKLTEEQLEYMNWHRANLFKS
ncbi:HNH endonuclease [Paenibacillus massiliensis]|uniref:HNH endonuclease n=1 Tax=Paenibacillus massiliensis TaxID=225917 RepID=UPI000402D881|nr:HNH endonuclease [Paenibacillus massiliensis]